jgi:hypothetical protein
MVNIPRITHSKSEFLLGFSTHKNRWTSGVSLWSEHKSIKLLVGRGSCIEAETQIARFANPHAFRQGRMSMLSLDERVEIAIMT